ncbi:MULTISPECIES: hypothetical protein [Bosea]|uniref:hypothetical protein n=1 Tax=Bosea TaxID=85413 RepID=UPI00214FE650|nr:MULTISPECIES: hypothetical protein [Bosea]MCR4522660.1 hypothetical protein [Bosea sp. 47.2.35]MDR6827168.1 hypothetical protein [Bosea robiniae]MDR6893878.1 hypothetical protein [Bosea sp. BE109]MDR7136422.1 hypothetical protein [Bosea sp. BE168]MDR7173121.1 hypothetical protein [Bosea sp. BE271]
MPHNLKTNIAYIENDRFHALVEALKKIDENDDEPRDKAIANALVEIGGVTPASWKPMHEASRRAYPGHEAASNVIPLRDAASRMSFEEAEAELQRLEAEAATQHTA